MQALRGFGEFNASLERYAKQLAPFLDEVVQNVGFEVFENIVVGGEFAPGTPVDTGFARNSWWVSLGNPGLPRQPVLPEERVAVDITSIDAAHPVIAQAHAGLDLWLLSNTAYMLDLEYGHSAKAPQGMIRLTLAQAQEIVDKIARAMGATG
jgi:hypothetical protein